MCGLFGYSTKKGVRLNHEKKMIRHLILNRLGIEMQTRGNHSSGVVFLEDKKIKTYKGAKSFARLREMPLFEEFTFNSPIIIGHTRAATMGAITPKNAHPFIKGSIVGVHNGIINSPHDIYPQAEVDSEAIFELLNKEKNDVEKVFPQLAGSMAVVWMNNEQPNKVFFLRHQNPLVTAEISDLDTVFWASTEHGLKSAIEEVLGKVKIDTTSLVEDMVYELQPTHEIEHKKVTFRNLYFTLVNQDKRGENDARRFTEEDPGWARLVVENADEELEKAVLNDVIMFDAYEGGCAVCGQLPLNEKNEWGFYFSSYTECVLCNSCHTDLLIKDEIGDGDYRFTTSTEFTKVCERVNMAYQQT